MDEVYEWIRELDEEGRGWINFEEFNKLMSKI